MKWKLIVIIIFLITIGASCSSKSNNWPRGMTPFFAECEGEGGTYTDKEYAKENGNLVMVVGNFMIGVNQP